MSATIRILLVDDNPFFLDAARDFLQLHKTLELVGTATDGSGALEQALKLRPDVILLDLNLGETSSIPLIPIIKDHLPQTRIVIVTILDEDGYSEAVLRSGADAFVRKQVMTQTLIPSILDLYEARKKFPNSNN